MTELSDGRRKLVLAICCMSIFMVGMDITIVNVALPTIQQSFHSSVSGLQWTIDAYTLVIASLSILSGSLADRFGRRRVFQAGLSLFAIGSLLCGVSPGLGWLIAFRCVQAVGGSMLNPVALSIIVNVFTERKERAHAMGVWSSVVGLSLALGPVLGGLLVSGIGWRSIFWINVPVGLAAIALTQLYVPESRAARARHVDVWGQALVAVSLGTLAYAIIEGPTLKWGSAANLGLFIVSALSLATFIVIESRSDEPLIDVRFFRSVPFSGANVIAFAALAALGGFLFINTLYLQDVRHFSALKSGLLILPMAVTYFIFGRLSGKLLARYGPRLPLACAGLPIATGALMLLHTFTDTPLIYLIATYFIFGIGFGLVNAPISNTAMAGMPLDQSSVAGAIASTSRQIGTSLGVAVTGSIIANREGIHFIEVSRAAWLVVAGCGVTVFALGLVSTSEWARGTAQRNAERMRQESHDVIS